MDVLDELADLATVEHALCVDYLLVHYALRTVVASTPALAGAANQALSMAQNAEMHHLARVNRVLVAAGRPPALGRAKKVAVASGNPVAVATMGPTRFRTFPDAEKAVAVAVDLRYEKLRQLVATTPDAVHPDLLGDLSFLLDTIGSHADRVDTLGGLVDDDLDLGELLADVRTDPQNENEREVLSVSDSYYRTVVAGVRAGLGPTATLLDIAIGTMDHLDRVNNELVAQGLVPAFDLD